MRKTFLFLTGAILAVICLCACNNSSDNGKASATPTPIPQISPEEVLPLESAVSAVGYELVSDGETEEDGVRSVLYRTEPIGKKDVVKVTVRQFSETVSKQEITDEFYAAKESRPSAETIASVGEDAFLAFPSIHIYKDGRYVEITAGSGADDTQRELLISLGRTAAGNIELAPSQPSAS